MMREVQINKNLKLREDGKLFNIRTGEEFIPKSIISGCYYAVRYCGVKKLVHRLVMELFGAPSPGDDYQIDHINRNTFDNRLENLRWVTRSENCLNKSNNLPPGERYNEIDLTTYNRNKQKRWRSRHKKQWSKYMQEWRKKHKKKKEGG